MAVDTSKSIVHVMEDLVLTTGVKGFYKTTVDIDFPSVAAAGLETVAATVSGAALGDLVVAGFTEAATAGLVVVGACVTAADTVAVTVRNDSGAPIDEAGTRTFVVVGFDLT